MKLEQRSLKAKEKFADSLMSLANTIHSAVLIGVLVLPLTTFIAGVFSGAEPVSFWAILARMSWPQIGIFGIVYLAPIIAGGYAKEKAMDIYDEVAKSSPNPTLNRTLREKAAQRRFAPR